MERNPENGHWKGWAANFQHYCGRESRKLAVRLLSFFALLFSSLLSYFVPFFGFDSSLAFASSLTWKSLNKEAKLLCLLSLHGFLVA